MNVRERNALQWKCTQGFVPVLGGLRNMELPRLVDKSTGEEEVFNMKSLLAEYDEARKEAAKERRRQKRLER